MCVLYCIVLYCIKRIYLNLFKSNQSTAGLKALKPAANGCYLMCKSSTYYFHLLYKSTLKMYPPVSKVYAGSFRVSVIHRILTWTTGFLTRVRSYACIYILGWGTPTTSRHNILTRKNSHKLVLCSGRDFEPLVMESIGFRGWRSTNWATTSHNRALYVTVRLGAVELSIIRANDCHYYYFRPVNRAGHIIWAKHKVLLPQAQFWFTV